MKKDRDYVRLVEQAQLGNKECLERLAVVAREELHDNVYRITLDQELAQDIAQETVLEMLKILGRLKEADRFWPWLYKIALNKIRLRHRSEVRHRTVPVSSVPALEEQKSSRQRPAET